MSSADRSVVVHVVAVDPPFGPEHGVLFGLQDKSGGVESAPATETTMFETTLELVGAPDEVTDFRGRHVHGRKGDRFLYLSWGASDGVEPFVMFARAKIKLSEIPSHLISDGADGGSEVECRVLATNDRGQPATGTVKAPAVTWSAQPPSRG